MRRREFIALVSATALAWRLEAHAQQPERMRRIGLLIPHAESDAESQHRVKVFQQALEHGRNIRIDYRWTAGEDERVRRLAKELVQLAPDVIVGQMTPSARALKNETSTI